MKKLLVLALVLVMTSVSMADMVQLRVKASDVKTDYAPSDFITLELVADFDAGFMTFNNLFQSGATTGLASAPALNAGWDGGLLYPGTVKNEGAELIRSVTGSLGTSTPDLVAGTVLWSFIYHVPDVPGSTYITFTANGLDVADTPYDHEVTELTAATIHVIPEPMTMALLGLGGLFLRRRK